MARTGQFGREPRSAPSLGSTLLSIAREAQARRDANIMDAWAKGGMFEGLQATDDRVLAYWRAKLKGLNPKDPLADAYRNNVTQLQYGIEQSKMDLLHVQGKVSDAQFAQFYLNWAKKVPKDSEFYRTLLKDAAQLSEGAKARGRAAAAQAKSDAFAAYADGVGKSHLALGDTMIGVMTQIARDNNLIGRDEDLSKFMLRGQDDPAIMETLLSTLNTDMAANPAKYKVFRAQILALDPSWNGKLTSGYFAKTLARQSAGYALIGTRAKKDGYTSWITWAGKGEANANELGIEAKAWPTGAAYTEARKPFDEVMNDPHSTTADKIAASDQLAKAIDKMAADPSIDPATRNRLQNDALALRGDPTAKPQPSFFENFLGLKGTTAGTETTGGTTSEGGAVKGEIAKWQDDQATSRYWESLAAQPEMAGTLVHASVKPGGDPANPEYDPSGKGPIGVVTVASTLQAGDVQVVPTTTVTGQSIMLATPVHKVYVTDPLTGKRDPNSIGSVMTYYQAGREVTLYGTKNADGTPNWTPVAPWADGATETKESGGDITVTLPPVTTNPAGDIATIDAKLKDNKIAGSVAEHFADPNNPPPDGSTWTFKGQQTGQGKAATDTTITVTWKNGQLQMGQTTSYTDEQGLNTGADTTPVQPITKIDWAQVAKSATRDGRNPAIDFSTAAMAALSSNQMSQDETTSLWTNPQFQTTLYRQEFEASGGDPAKLQALALADANAAKDIAAHGPASQTDKFREHAPANRRVDLIYPTTQTENQQTDKPAGVIRFGEQLTVPTVSPQVGQMDSAALRGLPFAPSAPTTPVAPSGSITPTPGITVTTPTAPTPTAPAPATPPPATPPPATPAPKVPKPTAPPSPRYGGGTAL